MKIHRCAIELEGTAKQYTGDVIALEDIYHQKMPYKSLQQSKGLGKQSSIKVAMHICMVLHSQN